MFSTGVILLVFIDASVHKCRKIPSRCVVFGCSNTPDLEQGIALHRLPYADDIRPVAVENRSSSDIRPKAEENRRLRNQLVDEKQKFLKHTLKEVGKDSNSTTVEELKTDSSSDEGREIPFSSDIGTDDSNLYCMKNPLMKKIKQKRKLMRIPIMELEGMLL